MNCSGSMQSIQTPTGEDRVAPPGRPAPARATATPATMNPTAEQQAPEENSVIAARPAGSSTRASRKMTTHRMRGNEHDAAHEREHRRRCGRLGSLRRPRCARTRGG